MLFISDIHGSRPALEKALAWHRKLDSKIIVILGDILNHGPRNPIPTGYDPQAVAEMLNQHAECIIAVRGNCDSEVDQMLCNFPIMAEYNWLVINGRRLCLTHGHQLNPGNLPPLAPNEGIAYGHTHIPQAEWQDRLLHFNPGSITSPKGGNVPSFGHFDGQTFNVIDFDGNTIASTTWDHQ